MRKNFAAWTVEPERFFSLPSRQEQAAFLVKFAVLAPSSHNSQPWRFRVSEEEIAILPELDRALPATDEGNRQLYVSLGCALENIAIAADAYGLETLISYEDRPESAGASTFARIALRWPATPRTQLPPGHRIHAIVRRATNRSPHDSRPIPAPMLAALQSESRGAVMTNFVWEPEQRRAIADLVLEGGAVAMADPGFRRELAAYLLPNNSKQEVGMTGATVGMGLVASWLVPKLLPRMNPRQKARPQEVKLLKEQTASFLVVSTVDDVPTHWMEAGRAYMRLALDAELLGLATNNLAAPVTPAPVRRKLAELLGTVGHPQMCIRLGFPSQAMPHSPRLPAEKVTETAAGA